MTLNRVVLSAIAATVASFAVALPTLARPATLIAQSGSRINVRSAPSTQAASPHYGLVGDRVNVLQARIAPDQYLWNYVKFASGATGWVRGDFVRYTEGMAQYAMLTGNPGDRVNVRNAPSTRAVSPHFGVAGDVVQVLTQKTGSDGYMWRYVSFPSGAEGWVRGDLAEIMSQEGCSQ